MEVKDLLAQTSEHCFFRGCVIERTDEMIDGFFFAGIASLDPVRKQRGLAEAGAPVRKRYPLDASAKVSSCLISASRPPNSECRLSSVRSRARWGCATNCFALW